MRDIDDSLYLIANALNGIAKAEEERNGILRLEIKARHDESVKQLEFQKRGTR